jgi:ABC-type transporter Mla MlaB component
VPSTRAHPDPGVLVIEGPIALADLPRLVARLHALHTATGANEIVCDVGSVTRIDARTVDTLARLQLTARRLGCRIRLRDAPGALQRLLALFGLSDAVPSVEPVRQPEEREHPGGVEERVERRDAPV